MIVRRFVYDPSTDAVAQTREQGVFVTDCVPVTFPAPKGAPNKGA
jgi:hypothetical protein